jgi:hypothetical protein
MGREIVAVEIDGRQVWPRLPVSERTVPLTLHKAALLMGIKGGKKERAKTLRRQMDAGAIAYEQLGRQSYVFNREDFPQEARAMVVPQVDRR